MGPNSPDQNNPLWAYAARTVQANAAEQDIKQLALRHHREALRQYLALRLGSEGEARTALAEIGVEVAQWQTAQLNAPPGPRAHLFALARRKVQQRGTLLAPQASGVVRLQHGERAAADLSKLPPEHAEILELRHARELTPVEIAFVIGDTLEGVQNKLHAAEAVATGAFGLADPAGVTIAAARTFALEPDPEVNLIDQEAAPLRPGTVIGERYTLEKAVGIGAFGQVYRASDNLVPGHTVALKLLHHPTTSEAERESALRELRLIASVFHPSVVSFKDHGWYHGRLWFVMPWYDGESLEDRMLREPLSRKEALSIFGPLANALASMHAAGVRHQDIKPENIFLAELKTDPLGEDQLQPVLLDLGVAASDAESIVAGTPAYFAPEVAGHYIGEPGMPPITEKADVFSLALALRNALEPETMIEVQGSALQLFIASRATEAPDPPTGRGLAFLRPYFLRWLSTDPDDRPTASEFATQLQVLLEPEQRAQRRNAFLSWFVPLTATFLVVLAGGAFVWSEQMREHERATFSAKMEARNAQLSAEREAALRKNIEQSHDELQDVHAKTTQARDKLAVALANTESEAKHLSKRARDLARARSATMDALEQTEQELADINAKADELNTTKEDLEKRLNESRQRVAELVEQASTLDQLLVDTRALLEKEQATAEQLRTKLKSSEDQRKSLEAARNAEREKVSRLEAQRDEARAEADQLTKQLEKVQKQLEATKAKLEKARDQAKKPKGEAKPKQDEPPAN